MSKMRRIVGALLLTAVIVADTVFLGDLPGSQETSQAGVIPIPKLVEGHKTYHENGTFKGCETGGSGCWMVYSANLVFTVSSEGVHIQ